MLSDRIQAAIGAVRVKVDTSQAKVNVDELSRRVSSIGQGGGARIKVDTTEADAKIAGIKAKLAEIANAKLAVAVDTAAADAKLIALNAEARKLREDIKGGSVDLDVEAAKARLAEISTEISGIRDAKAQVKVDTAEANVRVAALKDELEQATRDRRVKIDVDTAAARAEIAALKADASNASGGSSSGGSGGGFGLGLGISFLPALIPVAAAAVPVIGGIGAALLGAAAGGGVLKAAFTGIGDAVSALGARSALTGQQLKQQAAQQLSAQFSILNAQDAVAASLRGLANARTQAAQQAVSSAEAVRNAEQAATDARRSAATSIRNAQQGVTTAEQSYTSALYSEHQAQLALNQARAQAKQTLQDLANQVKDGSLSQRQATIDLQNALDNLKVVDFNPHSTAQQRAEAQLQVDQAKQHLSELELGNSRLAKQKAQADKQGVANAPSVVSAEHAMADATRTRENAARGVTQAQAALVEAQRAGAESVAKAEQGVSDALRSQAQQAASSQQAIISAQQSVVSSQRSLALAYVTAAAQGTAANDAVAESMAGLTPAGRRFAQFVNDVLKPAWKGVTDSAQAGFLPGFQKALTILLPYLPGFAKFVGDIARELGNMAVSASKALTGPFWRQFGTFLGQITGPAIHILGSILGNLATGFAGLFEALAPAGMGVGGGLTHITKAFADWATHLGTNKGFQSFLQFIKDNSPGIGKFFKDFAEIVGKLIVGFAPLGALLATVLEALAGFLSKLSPGQLMAIAAAIGVIAGALSLILGGPVTAVVLGITAVVGALTYAYTHFKWFRDVVNLLWLDIQINAAFLWNNVIRPTFNFIVSHWHYVATAFRATWDNFLYPLLQLVGSVISTLWTDAIKPTFKFIVDHWGTLADAFKATYNTVLKPVWSALTGAFTTVKTAFTTFKTGLSNIWDDIKKMFTEGVNFITQNVLNKFIGAINKVTHLFGIDPIPSIPKIGVAVPKSGSASAGGGGGSGSSHGNSNQYAMAHGGVLPGYAPGVDSVRAMLSPGEGVLVPEAVRGLGSNFVHAVNRHFSNRAPGSNGHFAGGGIVGFAKGIGHKIATGADKLGDLAAAGVALPARLALGAAERIANALLSHLEPEVIRNLGAGAFGLIDRGLHSLIGRSSVAASGATVSGPNSGSALDYARIIIGQARSMNLGPKGAEIALMTALVESGLKNYANANIPESLRLPHDAVGSDHFSAGLFQQQTGPFGNYWGTVAQVMNPAYSAHRFLDELLRKVPGYRNTDPGVAAQTVQVSAFPDAYSRRQGDADALLNKVKYDSGGYLQPGVTQVYNGTGRPEPVFTSDQWDRLSTAIDRTSSKPQPAGNTFNINEASDPYATAHAIARLQQFLANT